MIFLQQQLQWMQTLANNRPQWLNPFFLFLNYFDTDYFYLLIIPLSWVIFGKKFGFRLLIILLLNSYINTALKDFFQIPRPFVEIPSLGLLNLKSYSFPSGAAQGVIIISGVIYSSFKKTWLIPILLTYSLLISFSRIYLGVHYPVDILGGWFFGGILFLFYYYIFIPFEDKRLTPISRFAIISAFICALLIFDHSLNAVKILTLAFAANLGFFLLNHCNMDLIKSSCVAVRVIQISISLCFVVLMYFISRNLPIGNKLIKEVVFCIIMGITTSLGIVCLSNGFYRLVSKKP